MKTWLVTGASRGFGAAICKAVLAKGDRVIATARRTADLAELNSERLLKLPLDVTNDASVAAAVESAVAWSGQIDVLVNNAGHGMHGAIEEVSAAEVAETFDVNVFGLLRVTRAVLPVMRKQGAGHVINLGSVAGLIAGAGSGIYAATKFAVEGISEALLQEVQPLGIRVTVVEPGSFRTDFNGSSIKIAARHVGDYEPTAGKRTSELRTLSGRQPGDPAKVADIIFNLSRMSEPPLHLVLGNSAIDRARVKLGAVQSEIDRREHISRSAEFS